MDPWVWAILLLVLGLGLGVLEVFFPSAGLLGFLAASSILGAVIMGFTESPGFGFAILAAAVVGAPVAIVLGLKYWPKTSIGRRVLLMSPTRDEVLPQDPHAAFMKQIIGQVGRARCKMLPSGAITIQGRTIDAVTEGVAVEEGQLVRVIQFRGNRVVVRPVEDDEPSEAAEDPLQRPIDSVVEDPFDEEQVS